MLNSKLATIYNMQVLIVNAQHEGTITIGR